MAIEAKYFVPIFVLIIYSLLEGYSIDAQSTTSTTPWPELGARRGQNRPATPAPLRDFVSQPSVWNKPPGPAPNNLNRNVPVSNQGPSRPSSPTRDYVNPNIQLSYPVNTGGRPSQVPSGVGPSQQSSRPSSPTRDYVNPNIPISYANTAGGNSKPDSSSIQSGSTPVPILGRPSSPTRDNVNPNIPVSKLSSPTRDYVNPNIQLSYSNVAGGNNGKTTQKPQVPNQNNVPKSSTTSPLRDYVNPNSGGKPSYSNVLKPSNEKPAVVPSAASQTPTTPASRVPGSTNSNSQSTTPNPKVRLDENSELQDFSESLLRKDTNNGFKYVTVNYQGMTRSNSLKDEAPQNLMTIDNAAYSIPTVEKLIALHNNYIVQSNQNEVYTAQEKIEENNFLEAILPTAVMQHTRNFLISKGKISKDPIDFKNRLRTIWFNMYSRGGGRIGSSGFEHVYLAEIKNDVVSGLHNWIYFNDEEKKKTANYLGYMKKLEFDKGAIVKFHFNFQQIDKPVGTMFIGTSPEFEFALYSTCFLLRPDDVCPLKLGGKNFVIRTYTYRYRGKNMIGSAFPEI